MNKSRLDNISCGSSCFSGSPKGIEFNSVKEVLLSVKAVKSMHSLHLWALTLGQALVSVHLAIGNHVIFTVFFFYCRGQFLLNDLS